MWLASQNILIYASGISDLSLNGHGTIPTRDFLSLAMGSNVRHALAGFHSRVSIIKPMPEI